MNDIKNTLLDKIKAGEVTMVPRSHFVLRTVLWAFGALITFCVAVYLLSFIFFALNRSGVLYAPLYGGKGIALFIVSSPWLLISLVGLFLLVLYVLVSHYSFSYRKPLVYSMVGVVFGVILVSSLIHQTTAHERIQNYVERNQVPALAPLYQDAIRERVEGLNFGIVSNLTAESFTLTTRGGEVVRVEVTRSTKLPRQGLSEGMAVQVLGDQTDERITAAGVRPMKGRVERFIKERPELQRPPR